MEIITQNNEHLNIKGQIIMNDRSIVFKDVLLGKYKTTKRTCEVFAEMTCHSWTGNSGVYKMPAC